MTDPKGDSAGEEDIPKKKKEVSVDDLYRRSSQYQLWSFTSEELENVKKTTYEDGRIAALERFEETKKKMALEKPDEFQRHAAELTSDKLLDLITFDEQQKYIRFFAQQTIQTCNHFRMPTQVKATAVAFFQRFYLLNSPMSYHPKKMVFTCVFLAAKSENYFISIESFCSLLPSTEKSDILNLEFDVLQALKFTLLVHHPFRPLYGFFLDLQSVLLHPSPAMPDINIDVIGALYDEAKKWLNENALIGDLAFLFTPPQVALAALYDCNKRVTNTYLKLKFLKDKPKKELETILEEDKQTPDGSPKSEAESNLYQDLVSTIHDCIAVAKSVTESSREECMPIDKKCVFVLNPGKIIKKRLKAISKDAAPE